MALRHEKCDLLGVWCLLAGHEYSIFEENEKLSHNLISPPATSAFTVFSGSFVLIWFGGASVRRERFLPFWRRPGYACSTVEAVYGITVSMYSRTWASGGARGHLRHSPWFGEHFTKCTNHLSS